MVSGEAHTRRHHGKLGKGPYVCGKHAQNPYHDASAERDSHSSCGDETVYRSYSLSRIVAGDMLWVRGVSRVVERSAMSLFLGVPCGWCVALVEPYNR